MRARVLSPAALSFYGCFFAPAAWGLQHWIGFSINQARCNGPGRAGAKKCG